MRFSQPPFTQMFGFCAHSLISSFQRKIRTLQNREFIDFEELTFFLFINFYHLRCKSFQHRAGTKRRTRWCLEVDRVDRGYPSPWAVPVLPCSSNSSTLSLPSTWDSSIGRLCTGSNTDPSLSLMTIRIVSTRSIYSSKI